MTAWLLVSMVVILFAGALFGYDQGVISGALNGIKKTFVLTPLLVEVVTSWVTLGALFGALAGGSWRTGGRRTRSYFQVFCSRWVPPCRPLRPARPFSPADG